MPGFDIKKDGKNHLLESVACPAFQRRDTVLEKGVSGHIAAPWPATMEPGYLIREGP